MNEQQENHQQLIQEMRALTTAINRQAETNQSLCDLLVKIISEENEGLELSDHSSEPVTYLSGKARG
ncbi:hypothetical protein [Rahnella inusitata]|uniref:hypothetical protein n=1 Tax=Rahnella inusitata TaxID=58169 RepID=UPI001BC84040|nr:hypothetical protein [Rahnella inusitata]QUT14131.1 hypothetical protein I2123_15685 [Rahnella inusitata]